MADYYANDRYTIFDGSLNTLNTNFNILDLNAIYEFNGINDIKLFSGGNGGEHENNDPYSDNFQYINDGGTFLNVTFTNPGPAMSAP